MENTKSLIKLSFIFLITLIGAFTCDRNINKDEVIATTSPKYQVPNKSVKCANDTTLYKNIKKEILYVDSSNKVYLRRKNTQIEPNVNLSKCQKLPFVFLNDVALLDDSISALEMVVDVATFDRFKDSNTYFRDKNRFYVYRDYPVTYPPFHEIKIDKNNVQLLSEKYIKDNNNVYWNGLSIRNVEPKSFYITSYQTKKEGKYIFGVDSKYLFINDRPINSENFTQPMTKYLRDSLIKVYLNVKN